MPTAAETHLLEGYTSHRRAPLKRIEHFLGLLGIHLLRFEEGGGAEHEAHGCSGGGDSKNVAASDVRAEKLGEPLDEGVAYLQLCVSLFLLLGSCLRPLLLLGLLPVPKPSACSEKGRMSGHSSTTTDTAHRTERMRVSKAKTTSLRVCFCILLCDMQRYMRTHTGLYHSSRREEEPCLNSSQEVS